MLHCGSIGPLGIKIAPWGEISQERSREAFREQAQALYCGGIDLFILEAFQNLDELEQAILGVRDISDLPIIAQMVFQEEDQLKVGVELACEMAVKVKGFSQGIQVSAPFGVLRSP